jgi:hypothetical protein
LYRKAPHSQDPVVAEASPAAPHPRQTPRHLRRGRRAAPRGGDGRGERCSLKTPLPLLSFYHVTSRQPRSNNKIIATTKTSNLFLFLFEPYRAAFLALAVT